MSNDVKLLLTAVSAAVVLIVLVVLLAAGADITGCIMQKGIYL